MDTVKSFLGFNKQKDESVDRRDHAQQYVVTQPPPLSQSFVITQPQSESQIPVDAHSQNQSITLEHPQMLMELDSPNTMQLISYEKSLAHLKQAKMDRELKEVHDVVAREKANFGVEEKDEVEMAPRKEDVKKVFEVLEGVAEILAEHRATRW